MKIHFLNFTIILVSIFSINVNANGEKIEINSVENFDGGVISGRLLKANGRFLANTEIELVPLGAKKLSDDMRLWAISNYRGYFAFKNVPTGSYTLSLNFNAKPIDTSPFSTVYYPKTKLRSEAKIFKVENGSKFTKLRFRVFPKLLKKTITGKAVWSDGKPVKDAFITLLDVEVDTLLSFRIKTNAQGFFSLKGFIGRKYVAEAILLDSTQIDIYTKPTARGFSKEFVLDSKSKTIKIVMKKLNSTKPKKEPIDDRIVGMKDFAMMHHEK